MQRGNLVVKRFTAFIKASQLAAERLRHQFAVDFGDVLRLRGADDLFQRVQQPSRVAVCVLDDELLRFGRDAYLRVFRQPENLVAQLGERIGIERFERIDLGARQQGGVSLQTMGFRWSRR